MKKPTIAGIQNPQMLAKELIAWYQINCRKLPFRMHPDPYVIWISEIMAQQTRMEALLPYFERFIDRFPDLPTLANADEDDLMKVWQGLGYYSRARKLHACAKTCMEQYNGRLPETYEKLVALPGIGPYTAGAVASIAFGEKVPAVDGNVIRVFSRITALEESVTPAAMQKQIRLKVQEALPTDAGTCNQALMELGALICLPKNPKCSECPIERYCLAKEKGIQEQLPKKDAKKARTIENKKIYVLAFLDHDRTYIHLLQRPKTGLLAGLYGFDEAVPDANQLENWSLKENPRKISLEPYRHVFTHKEWVMEAELLVYEPKNALENLSVPKSESKTAQQGIWVSLEDSESYAIPSAFAPFYKQALAELESMENEQHLPCGHL